MMQTVTNILNVKYEQGVLHKLFYRQAQNIHKFLIRGSGNYYLKPNDIISHRPSLFGYHEPHLEALFAEVSKTHHDFLLDIGANVGMTAVMVGRPFQAIHCVEPNRIISRILDVNLALADLSQKTTIHEIGLGTQDKTEKLHIPRLNFGGAYIPEGNAYQNADVMKYRDNDEVIIQDIEIKEADRWFKALFANNPNWQNGVIKIDVEGFELHVFQALLNHIPKGVSVVVIMENFLDKIDFGAFKTPNHKLEWFGFYKQKQYLKSAFFKLFAMSSYYKQTVERIDKHKKAPHDLIVYFQPS